MFKKLLSIFVLTIFLTASLGGCGGTTPTTAPTPDIAATADAAAADEAAIEAAVAAALTEAAPTEEPTPTATRVIPLTVEPTDTPAPTATPDIEATVEAAVAAALTEAAPNATPTEQPTATPTTEPTDEPADPTTAETFSAEWRNAVILAAGQTEIASTEEFLSALENQKIILAWRCPDGSWEHADHCMLWPGEDGAYVTNGYDPNGVIRAGCYQNADDSLVFIGLLPKIPLDVSAGGITDPDAWAAYIWEHRPEGLD